MLLVPAGDADRWQVCLTFLRRAKEPTSQLEDPRRFLLCRSSTPREGSRLPPDKKPDLYKDYQHM
jgi:hypothetical protein